MREYRIRERRGLFYIETKENTTKIIRNFFSRKVILEEEWVWVDCNGNPGYVSRYTVAVNNYIEPEKSLDAARARLIEILTEDKIHTPCK